MLVWIRILALDYLPDLAELFGSERGVSNYEESPSYPQDQIIEQSPDIVAAYVTRNHVAASELPALIQSVHAALVGLTQPASPPAETVEKPTPAQIRKSI